MFVALSSCGMLLIALTPASHDGGSIGVKMLGVILASLSSGGGELSFLGLTHFYGHFSLAAWGSGTGGAGLVGAGAYVVATTWMGLSVKTSLFAFSFLPIFMLVSFFVILPREPLKGREGGRGEYESIPGRGEGIDGDDAEEEESELLESSMHSNGGRSFASISGKRSRFSAILAGLKANLKRSQSLFFP